MPTLLCVSVSVLGLTLDYGPFGFLDMYDPAFIANATGASCAACRAYAFLRRLATAIDARAALKRARRARCRPKRQTKAAAIDLKRSHRLASGTCRGSLKPSWRPTCP